MFVLVCLGVSYLIAYLSAFKDDVYKAYFKKFKKEKNDLKWHVLTFFVCLGSLYSVYLSIGINRMVLLCLAWEKMIWLRKEFKIE